LPFNRSAWLSETGHFGNAGPSRFSISDIPFRENAIGNRFRESRACHQGAFAHRPRPSC
jgi:hypothetical protein